MAFSKYEAGTKELAGVGAKQNIHCKKYDPFKKIHNT